MNLSKTLITLLAVAGLTVSGATLANTTKEAHDQAVKAADTQYKTDKATCDSLSGNAEDICEEQAKGKMKVAKADADAAYHGTPKAREAARVARADAAYEVAKEKCDDLAGNAKDVCVKEAKATHVKGKADAKVDRVAAEESHTASQNTANARADAAQDKRNADYKVAVEKCDSLAGGAKDACKHDAKARYGKS